MRSLAGTETLARLVVRRDRVRLAVWVVALVGVTVVSAASIAGLYPDADAVAGYARLFDDNPALVAFAGPGYGLDDPNVGAILVNEVQLWGAIGVSLMAIFLVARNTRAEEDTERVELLATTGVGRAAPTAAAIIVAASAVVAVGVASGIGFVAFGFDAIGSVALAASFTVVGLLFASITALAAQVAGTSRACVSVSLLALVVAFVVRAVGDVAGHWVRWLSPVAWAQAVRAYAGEQWWFLGACLALAVVVLVAAFAVVVRRDLGSGWFGVRPGKRAAPVLARHPLFTPARLQRAAFAGWLVGLVAIAAVYGSFAESVDDMLADTPELADFFAQSGAASPTDSFLATALALLALVISGLGIATALAANTEERAGRAALVLAGPTRRGAWLASHVASSLTQVVVALAVTGATLGAAYAISVNDPSQVLRLTVASLALFPAVLVLTAVAVALFGVVPRLALAAWAVLAVAVTIGLFAELLKLPGWVRGLSPFQHLPALPAEPFTAAGPAALTVAGIALLAVGAWGLGRRDLEVT